MQSRVAVVTGGGSGIGAGIARALAGLGHRVAVLDRVAEGAAGVVEEIRAAGGSALAVSADISDPGGVDRAVGEVTAAWGPVGILVNNAGFARDNPVLDMPLADWDSVLDTHLRGSFLLLKATAPGMRAAEWGRIVNISSISALGDDERVNYVAAKAGLEGLTRAAALDLAPFGITVNAVGPGVVQTAMTTVSAARAGRTLEEHLEVQAKSIPRGRIGTPHDIARAVLFFAAEDADFVTGQVLYVSGGPHG
ncbi:SDR family NAD(P)-dependent oxidoreductase [Crossiella cryophila]|uniref:3-oxoacyl-[acyl-carrier protein] reductase n=1 Tax=Crossiella cryophila TaxID=43355 RepID=A0A7W7FX15_9PSEU|nr:SDR family NAD(P)-dependent oxidoreductase [Crossiella cryophila]MBB4680168.1 3-oxoacyl-[acyl-carrier protein] reductase [Crossiella cryophila]